MGECLINDAAPLDQAGSSAEVEVTLRLGSGVAKANAKGGGNGVHGELASRSWCDPRRLPSNASSGRRSLDECEQGALLAEPFSITDRDDAVTFDDIFTVGLFSTSSARAYRRKLLTGFRTGVLAVPQPARTGAQRLAPARFTVSSSQDTM